MHKEANKCFLGGRTSSKGWCCLNRSLSSFPGPGSPLPPLPHQEDGASFWSLPHWVPKPGERAWGPAGRSLRAGAGAPGRGSEWGLVRERGRPGVGCSGAGFWAESAPQPRGATPGPRSGALPGGGPGKPGQGQRAAAGPARGEGAGVEGGERGGVSWAGTRAAAGEELWEEGARIGPGAGRGRGVSTEGPRGGLRAGRAGRSAAAAGGVRGGGARLGGRGAASAPGVGERVGRLRRIRFSRCR